MMRERIAILGMGWAVLSCHAAPTVWREPLTGIEFVRIDKGCFAMGQDQALSPGGNQMWDWLGFKGNLAFDATPRHEVCLAAFWIARHEVRADDWLRVMQVPIPQGGGPLPAANITWQAARDFAARLGALQSDASRFRLPTEAEWEYACRAGQANDKAELAPSAQGRVREAWYAAPGRHLSAPQAVGQLQENGFGLHDMLGNVWEWVEDGYRADGYRQHALFNPRVPAAPDGLRVIRGASYRSEYLHVRCGMRSAYAETLALEQIGFRLIRVPPTDPATDK